MDGRHLLQVPPRNITHPKQARASGIALLPHRFPHLSVGSGPVVAGRRAMQDVTVDVVSPQMFERTGHRLRDLNRKAGRGIVGQPVVLTGPVREFRLQEEICARDQARAIGGRQSLTDSRLDVVPPLVGGIDAPKTHAQRKFDQGRGAVFLPGGAVEKIGNG